MPTQVSPRDLQRRKFQHIAAQTMDKQAGVIGQLVEAINQTNEAARVSREFVADLSTRVDEQHRRLAVAEQELKMLREHYIDMRRQWVTFAGRLRWLFTGK